MIDARDVAVIRGGRRIVERVTLHVDDGQWLALIGPNGAGKSTLLSALAGGPVASGEVCLEGVPLHRMSARQRAQRIAVVDQQPLQPAGMRVADYVALGRTPFIAHFGRAGVGDRRVVADALARLDLVGFRDRALETLSGGEWQRVVIARALAQQPGVLILDEPTSALDLGRQVHVLDLVAGLRAESGLTVVSATHDLSLAAAYSDRVVLISGGAIVAQGTPREVITEAVLEEHYGAAVRVLRDADGHLAVVPRRAGSS